MRKLCLADSGTDLWCHKICHTQLEADESTMRVVKAGTKWATYDNLPTKMAPSPTGGG